MSKNTNLSFLTDYITADITNGRIGINTPSPTVAFDVTGVAKFSSSVGIGNPSTIEGVLTIKGTSAQPPTSGTTANSLLQLVGSLNNELNIGSNTVAGSYGSYIQASDNNLAVPYPLNLQPNGGSVGIGNGTGTVGTLNVTGRIALTSSLFFSSNLTSEDRWEINVATPANDLYFSRSGVGERMRILSNGNVGIGTSSPSVKLQVEGAILLPSDVAGTSGYRLNYTTADGGSRSWKIANDDSTYGDFSIKQSSTQTGTTYIRKFVINPSGSVTISSLGSGAVTATSGTLSTTSDMTLKIEDGYIDNALEKISQLKPRYFYWKEESGLPTDIRQLGFYAQEVNQALGEEAANTPKNENDKWGIYDRGIIAMLTKGIQELKAEIETLKNK